MDLVGLTATLTRDGAVITHTTQWGTREEAQRLIRDGLAAGLLADASDYDGVLAVIDADGSVIEDHAIPDDAAWAHWYATLDLDALR